MVLVVSGEVWMRWCAVERRGEEETARREATATNHLAAPLGPARRPSFSLSRHFLASSSVDGGSCAHSSPSYRLWYALSWSSSREEEEEVEVGLEAVRATVAPQLALCWTRSAVRRQT